MSALPDAPPDGDQAGWPDGMLGMVPVYNHGATVATVVAQLRALGARVLVIDDGSQDGSGAAAAAAGAEVVRFEVNRGKGAALARGLELAAARGYTRLLTCDADLQHPPAAVRALCARVAGAQAHAILVGSRAMAAAPLASRCGRRWSDLWTWIACGAWPGDSQSGLRAYPLPACAQLRVRSARYAFEVEVLVRAVWAGLTIVPVPVPVVYPPDRISHFRTIADNRRTAATFFRLVARRLLPLPHRQLVARPRPTLRQLLLSGLEPLPAAAAAALGAGCAVAPVPGLQSVITAFVAWRLRLNLPLALLMSNLSFGPLLPMWAALSGAIGMWLRLGQPPWRSWPALSADLRAHHQTMEALLALGQRFFLDWLLGSLVVVPAVMVLAGMAAFAAARALTRRRAQP